MIIIVAQFDKMSGPDSIGQHKLVLSMDESINKGSFNPMQIKKGTQFLVTMIEADTQESKEFASETLQETQDRFFKHFHALITDIAKLKDIPATEYKEKIKGSLIKDGSIKESTKELSVNQLAELIVKLKKIKATL